jgi:hypothetical protein
MGQSNSTHSKGAASDTASTTASVASTETAEISETRKEEEKTDISDALSKTSDHTTVVTPAKPLRSSNAPSENTIANFALKIDQLLESGDWTAQRGKPFLEVYDMCFRLCVDEQEDKVFEIFCQKTVYWTRRFAIPYPTATGWKVSETFG